MDRDKWKHESTALLPSLGWLLLNEEERQLLQASLAISLWQRVLHVAKLAGCF